MSGRGAVRFPALCCACNRKMAGDPKSVVLRRWGRPRSPAERTGASFGVGLESCSLSACGSDEEGRCDQRCEEEDRRTVLACGVDQCGHGDGCFVCRFEVADRRSVDPRVVRGCRLRTVGRDGVQRVANAWQPGDVVAALFAGRPSARVALPNGCLIYRRLGPEQVPNG